MLATPRPAETATTPPVRSSARRPQSGRRTRTGRRTAWTTVRTAARTPAATCSCIVVTGSVWAVSPTRWKSPDRMAASSTHRRMSDSVRPGRSRRSPRCTTGRFQGTSASGPRPRPACSTATSHTGPLPTRNSPTPESAAAGTSTTSARFAHRPFTPAPYAAAARLGSRGAGTDERTDTVADDESPRRDGGDPRDPDGQERNETNTERADRNWNELMQELRVTQTGLQILTGFLLTVPFQQRFGELGPGLRVVFLV